MVNDNLIENYQECITPISKSPIKLNEEDYGGEAVDRVLDTIMPHFYGNGRKSINDGKPYIRYEDFYDKRLANRCQKAKSHDELKRTCIEYVRMMGPDYNSLNLLDLKWVRTNDWMYIFKEIHEDYSELPVVTKEQEEESIDDYYNNDIKNLNNKD